MKPSSLCISIRFLQSMCHARGDLEQPEWPPSPLRVFQSLVAAAAARWNERERIEHAADCASLDGAAASTPDHRRPR